MDHDSMLHFTSAHFSPVEPVRFHGGSGFSSSAEEELSSDSSEGNPPRPQTLASSSGRLPIDDDDDDDNYSARFPVTEDFSNNSSYGGAPPAPALTHPPARAVRGVATSASTDENSIRIRMMVPTLGAVRYRECMKNHAASLGGHALDGCGEFICSGADGFDALVCSACGCHRNFHRREVEGEHVCTCNKRYANLSTNANVRGVSGPPTPGLLTMSTSRDIVLHPQVDLPMSPLHYDDDADVRCKSSSRKRRHRTKFSAEQKERMFSFAEHLGWRIVKQSDTSVQQFCDEVGVKRSVFKVWMHNNKHNGAKRMNVGEPPMTRNYESPSDY